MKARALILSILMLVLAVCKSSTEADAEKAANIILDGSWTQGMTSYSRPVFNGYVKNAGNGTGYNCGIDIQCFSDNKITIIDTASGFPADLGDIAPGQRASFEAVCFKLTSWSQVKATDYKITWLNR